MTNGAAVGSMDTGSTDSQGTVLDSGGQASADADDHRGRRRGIVGRARGRILRDGVD